MMPDRLTEDAGRLFEAGFMLGVLRALETAQLAPDAWPGRAWYAGQREAYPTDRVLDAFARPLPGESERVTARMLGRVYLTHGHLAGYTFLREYLCAMLGVTYPIDDVRAQKSWRRATEKLRVRYLQLSLYGANQLAPHAERIYLNEEEVTAWLAQLALTPDAASEQDRRIGGFLHADLLLWLEVDEREGPSRIDPPGERDGRVGVGKRGTQSGAPELGLSSSQRILVIDTSIASGGASAALTDLGAPGGLTSELWRDIRYLSGQSAFSRLAFDALSAGLGTGEEEEGGKREAASGSADEGRITNRLTRYFNAFAADDKESSKLIQAGSYAQGFLAFLRRHQMLTSANQAQLHVQIVGYTGRNVNSMTLRPDQFSLLDACATIYQEGKRRAPLEEARALLYDVITRNASGLFKAGNNLMTALRTTLPEQGIITFEETLQAPEDYANTALAPNDATLRACGLTADDLVPWQRPGEGPTIRAAHAALVERALQSGKRYLFLTGSPGIGKTTTIARYLQRTVDHDGYLFFYASPRTAVNDDIFEKFSAESPESAGGAPTSTFRESAAIHDVSRQIVAARNVPDREGAPYSDVLDADGEPVWERAQLALTTERSRTDASVGAPGRPDPADPRLAAWSSVAQSVHEQAGALSSPAGAPTAVNSPNGTHQAAPDVQPEAQPTMMADLGDDQGNPSIGVDTHARERVAPRPSARLLYATHSIGLTTNAHLIRDAGNRPAVKYLGLPAVAPRETRGIQFLNAETAQALGRRVGGGRRPLRPVAEDTLQEGQGAQVGVLKCLCDAIGATMDEELPAAHGGPSRAIIASVAIQALKRRGERQGDDTLEHLRGIFGAAWDSRAGRFIPEHMHRLAKRVRHLVFMVDEITGDDAGVAFYQRLADCLESWKLEQYGFQVTIIVSDASITGEAVVRAHFARGKTEPDTRKIFLALDADPAWVEAPVAPAPDPSDATTAHGELELHTPLISTRWRSDERGHDMPRQELASTTHEMLQAQETLVAHPMVYDQGEDAYLVNCNAFPAAQLHLRYRLHLLVEHRLPRLGREGLKQLQKVRTLEAALNADIVDDICAHLECEAARRADTSADRSAYRPEQILVYVQNKARLQEIIARVTRKQEAHGRPFVAQEHYAQLHADSSENDRVLLMDERARDAFLVIFMTSSASRGLSFGRARHLLLEVPRFGLEAQLMELVQALFRARGGAFDTEARFVTFYLGDRVTLREDRVSEMRNPRDLGDLGNLKDLSEVDSTPLSSGVVGHADWAAGEYARIREATLDLLTMLCVVKLCVLTRIAGFASLRGGRRIRLAPIGGKSVSAAGGAYHLDLADFAYALRKERVGIKAHDPALKTLEDAVNTVLGRADFLPPATPSSYLDLYAQLTPETFGTWLTSATPLQDAYVAGRLLIVPLLGEVETHHHLALGDIRNLTQGDRVEQAIRSVIGRRDHYAPAIGDGARTLRDVLQVLKEATRTQRLEHRGARSGRYYVLPIPVLLTRETTAEFCQEMQREGRVDEAALLKDLLITAFRDSYPLDSQPLPTGVYYRNFPFLIVTSQDLAALRRSMFEQGRLLMSREMNILTMLLAQV